MCFKANDPDGRARARERLQRMRTDDRRGRDVPRGPRATREPDPSENKRAEERLLAVVGH